MPEEQELSPWMIHDPCSENKKDLVPLSKAVDESIHEYKVWHRFFGDILSRKKKFEVRKDDRDETIQEGDTVVLREWCPNISEYTGRIEKRRVTYVIYGFKGGFLPPGYLVFAIADESL